MLSRKIFIKLIFAFLFLKEKVFTQAKQMKRSRWDILFSDHKIEKSTNIPTPNDWSDEKITVTWIGHATVLINFYGTWILTDPVFSDKVGPSGFGIKIGTKRLIAPALPIKSIPKIDLILLSHGHFDHLDIESLKKFNKEIKIIMAKNTSDIISDLNFTKISELDWNEKINFKNIQIEAVEVKHFGWRYPWEKDRSRGNVNGRSYNAYLIYKNGKYIFFGGDTAYQKYFSSVGKRNIKIELAIMPIGAYDPWVNAHANPEETILMSEQLNVKNILPIHWRTFILSDEPTMEPINRLKKINSKINIALDDIGKTWEST